MQRIANVFDNGGRTFDRYRVQFALPGMDDGEHLDRLAQRLIATLERTP